MIKYYLGIENMKIKKNNFKAYTILSILIITSCNLNPNYQKPVVTSDIVIPKNDSSSVPAYNLGWQDYFTDKRLKNLIKLALNNNKDLIIATLNVEEAARALNITQSNLFPKLNASGNMDKNKTPTNLNQPNQAITSKKYQAGIGISSFEIDFFGKLRNLNQASLHKFLSTKYAQEVVHISLIATIAKAYYTNLTAKEAMDVSDSVRKNREESYNLAKSMLDQGLISAIELNQAETQVEQAKVSFEEQKRIYLESLNTLTLLVGQKIPDALPKTTPLDEQFKNIKLPSGIPSEVLNNRPDIKQAEELLKAANANIGVARAAFFPSIKLTGSYGYASSQLNNLFKSGYGVWSFIPQINIPIFNAGELKASLDLAKIRKNKAIVQYEKTVQQAFKEISDAINAYDTLSKQYEAQTKIKNAENERLRLIEIRYKNGIDNAINLLDSQRQSFSADINTLQTRLMVLNNKVDIYKVLGGGLLETTIKIIK